MRTNTSSVLIAIVLAIATSISSFAIENAVAPAPNSDPTYQKLRNIGLSGEAVQVSNFTLRRDAGTFQLKSGTVCFVSAVEGKVTGAVFAGQGEFTLSPPTPTEARSLSLLTRQAQFQEVFERAVLRFTDDTYDEIKKSGTSTPANCDAGTLRETQQHLRTDLHYNLTARILQDVLGTAPAGLFVAFIHGKNYNKKMIYSIDPRGASPLIMELAPEEVQLATYDESKVGVWAAFHLASEYKNRTASSSEAHSVISIEHQTLDTSLQKSGNLTGKAVTTFVSHANGLRVIPFNLHGTLRVQSVTTESGQQLAFIQEDKKDDPDYYVILSKPLAINEKLTIITNYAGKDAILSQGGDNYYPVARTDWFPNHANEGLGEFAAYDMTFRIPKGMKMVATGQLISDTEQGDHNVSVWKSEAPMTAAGFIFGKFKREQGKVEKPSYQIEAYANSDVPDAVRGLLHAAEGDPFAGRSAMGAQFQPQVALGTMSTTGMAKKALAEAQLAVQLFSNYFGPTPFSRLAIAQQTAMNYGQSWPELVWLPMSYFYDNGIRHQLGMNDPRGYFRVVAAHEVAHQWWGHTVGFNSYRDQWMSEGFADMSASLYLQNVYNKEPEQFRRFWSDEHELLLERNKEGFRAIDAGPLTQGYRLSNTRTGFDSTRRLIYPKGAYVLHMIRMMMWDRRTGDRNFAAMMQDFTKTYTGRSATTEDFKAMVEKHMTPDMASFGNGKMDWFFDEYVYGTALPSYKLDYSFGKDAGGQTVARFSITQSNVDDRFRMLVPLYLELADGHVVYFGHAAMNGNTTMKEEIPLNGLKDPPKKVIINYMYDVLAN